MSIQIKQKTVDIAVEDNLLEANVLKPTDRAKGKIVRLHYSLIGEVTPLLSPLSLEFSFDDQTLAYRYDWVVGFTPVVSPVSKKWEFDWREDLKEERALCVQLLIDCGGTGLSYTEVSALLLGLQPSKESASWLETHIDKIGQSLTAVSDLTRPLSSTAASLIKVSAVMSNFVKSDGKQKNWFLYRFLDEKKQCCAIEWNIHKSVVVQYGPLLRGSVILTFHGTPKENQPIRMLLRPRLALAKAKELNYVPPENQLEDESPVVLDIMPSISPAKRQS